MKSFFFITLAFLFQRGTAFSQSSCATAPINPSVTQPIGAGIVSSTCSTLVVKWQGSPTRTYCVNATYFNASTNKKDTVYGTNITCDGSQSCTATIPVTRGAKITWSVQALTNGNASYPVTNALESPIRACNGPGVSICGKVFLQGAYDAIAKKMSNALNTSGILQAKANKQPYNNPAFNYAGLESVSNSFFAAHTDIVDWILVELRDGNAPSATIARRAAFVKQDGTLVDTNGISTQIFFPGIAVEPYYMVIRHRNHLAIRTLSPPDFNCSKVCYDFTTAGYKTFKKESYTSGVQMGNVWAMRAGNANSTDNVKFNGPGNQQNQILNIILGGSLSKVLSNVYSSEDINMDGVIKWNGPGNDQNFLLNIILGGSLSTIYNQQL